MAVPDHHLIPEPPAFDAPPYANDIFAGKTVFVSGGGTGMGFAMAVAFAQGGANVAVVGRSLEKAQGGAARIAEHGVATHAVSCDVRSAEAVAVAFDEVERVLGPVTLLANHTSPHAPRPMGRMIS